MGKIWIVLLQIAVVLLDLLIQRVGISKQSSFLKRGVLIILLIWVVKGLKKLSARLDKI